MPSLRARLYTTGHPVELTWNHGLITALGSTSIPASALPWLAPSLVDLQVNGFAGIDFQQDDLTAPALLHATRALHQAGCGRYFLTLITDEWPRLIRRLEQLRQLRLQLPELSAAIAGWHLEGPFLSTEPGYCGAHNPALMPEPTADHIRELRAAAGTDGLLLTLAPERMGAIPAIQLAVELGCRVSLGHTNATAELLQQARQAGASGFTHLGNACPQLLDRHDNILWRVLDLPRLQVSLIPDAIHVAPPLFRLLHRVLDPARIHYVSDATAAAGAPPGLYTIGQIPIQAGADQIVRQPGKTHFAGSALRPIDGVFRAAQMLGRSWRDTWDAFSLLPARYAGLTAELRPGAPADFCLLELEETEPALRRLQLFRAGQQIA
jgi:N-acetylglucosamine-6-phosphate deacetylase